MSWLLAQTKSGAWEKAGLNLKRQGFKTFQPLERRMHIRRNKVVPSSRPYFGNYIFVWSDNESAPVSAIRSTVGVLKLIEFGRKIAEVPADVMEHLLDSCDENGFLNLSLTLAQGSAVKMAHGPLRNQLGRVDSLASQDRVWVLLDVMGVKTRARVDRKDVVSV